MTQYYEQEARKLESLGNDAAHGSAGQVRYWREASRVGTRVVQCISGLHDIPYPGTADRSPDCDEICED